MSMDQNPIDALSPEKMQLFMAGLSGLAPEEVRKAKVLYIRNAISELKAMRAGVDGFARPQGCLAIIPLFWPVMSLQKKIIDAQTQLAKERIRNAIDVWNDDLKGERFEIDDA
jgi:hypothetical protein